MSNVADWLKANKEGKQGKVKSWLLEDDASRLGATLDAARQKQPDQYADSLKLSEKAGLPVDAVEQNREKVEQGLKRRELDPAELLKSSPGVANWLLDPSNAAIAHDEVDKLTDMEAAALAWAETRQGVISGLRGTSSDGLIEAGLAFRTGTTQLGAGGLSLAIAYGLADPNEWAETLAVQNQRLMQLHSQRPEFVRAADEEFAAEGEDVDAMLDVRDEAVEKQGNWLTKTLAWLTGSMGAQMEGMEMLGTAVENPRATTFLTVEQLPNSLPAMAAGAGGAKAGAAAGAPAGPWVSAIGGFGGFALGTFSGSVPVEMGAVIHGKMLESGIDPTDAEQIKQFFANEEAMAEIKAEAARKGLTTAGVDALWNMTAGKLVSMPGKGVGKKLAAGAADTAVQMTGEGVSEAAGQLAQTGEVNAGEAVMEGIISGPQGVVDTVIGATLRRSIQRGDDAGTMSALADGMMKSEQAKESGNRLSKLVEAVQGLKSGERSAERTDQLLQSVLGDGELYLSADQLSTLFQTNEVDLQEALGALGVDPEDYRNAAGTGGDVAVPAAKLVRFAARSDMAEDLVRIVRTDPEAMSAAEAEAFDAESREQVEEYLNSEVAGDDATQPIYDDIYGQLTAAGVREQDAQYQARVHQAMFRTLAERTGQDANELYARYNLRIGREVPAELRGTDSNAGMDMMLAPLMSRLRAGDIPTDSDVYGQSLVEFLRERGGIVDEGGELGARDADINNKPFQRNLIQPEGMTLDEAAEAALQAGYLGEYDQNQLLDLVDRELRGEPVYVAGNENREASDLRSAIQLLEEEIRERGLDIDSMTDEQIIQALMEAEQAQVDGDRIEQPGTPAFDAWFGDSKVVDENGEPLVVYHGTTADISQFMAGTAAGFGEGIYLTDNPEYASEFAYSGGGNVVPVYVRIENPSDGQFPGVEAVESTEAWRDVRDKWDDSTDAWSEDGEFAGKVLRELGYDGIISLDSNDTDGLEIVAFSPEQIKSVNNRGTFDPNDPNILNQEDLSYIDALPEAEQIAALKAKVQELENELRTSDVTGMRNQRAFTEDESLGWPSVAAMDMDGLKRLNDTVGHEPADKVLEALGGLMIKAEEDTDGVRLYHRSGDEFAARFRDADAADAFMADLQARLDSIDVEIDGLDADGNEVQYVYEGIGLSYGIGDSYEAADVAANQQKRERLAAGVREDARKNPTRPPRRLQRVSEDGDRSPAAQPGRLERILSLLGIDRLNQDSPAPAGLSDSGVQEFARAVQDALDLTDFELSYSERTNAITLRSIIVPKDEQRGGKGSEAVRQLVNFADQHGVRILLTPAHKDEKHGTTSRSRLVKFYKRFGFVENKGRNKDFSTMEGMYREPASRLDQSAVTETPEFQRWFDGSVVVDENGEPLVVYHGTGNTDSIFDGGFDPDITGQGMDQLGSGFYFTTDPDEARGYETAITQNLPTNGVKLGGDTSPGTVDVFLSIQNPIVIEGSNLNDSGIELTEDQVVEILKYSESAKHEEDSQFGNFFEEYWDGGTQEWMYDAVADTYAGSNLISLEGDFFDGEAQNFRTALRDVLGFDGVVQDFGEGKKHFVAWFPEQIKSASRNSGAFDPSSRNILEQNDKGPRGFMTFDAARNFSITLTQRADLSTFLHESGHFFLEVLADAAEQSDQVAGDFQTILDWLGVESRDDILLTSKRKDSPEYARAVEAHEKWARGFEAYLREGKAPSQELASAFARFRAWLVGIYRSIKRLNVNLSDEVRGVMDRMLATDDEIAAARRDQGYDAMFETAEQAGMTDEEWAEYQRAVQRATDEAQRHLAGKAMDEYRKANSEWWSDRRAEIEQDVLKGLDGNPVYVALSWLRTGKMPSGADLPGGIEPAKIDKQSLLDLYGQAFLTKNLRRLNIYRLEGGIPASVAAEMLGFSSVDEMIKKLVDAAPMKQYVAAEAERRMQEQYPDMFQSGEVTEQAMAAVHNDKQQDLLYREATALGKSIDKKPSARAVAKQMAKDVIARTPVKRIRPSVYRMAEAKAARLAFEAAAKGDRLEAFNQKQRQIMNFYLYRESEKAVQEADTIAKRMREFNKPAAQQRIGKAGGSYLEQINQILELYDFRKVGIKQIERRQSLRDWINSMRDGQEDGLDVGEAEAESLASVIPPWVMEQAEVVNYRELSMEELRGVDDSVRAIAHLARVKNKLLTIRDKRELAEVVAEVVDTIRANGPGLKPGIETRLPKDEAMRTIDWFFASHRKIASLFKEMDGLQDGGVMWQTIMRPINEAGDKSARMKQEAAERFRSLFDLYSKDELVKLYDQEYIAEIDQSLSKQARIAVALNWGNEDSRQKIMDGYKWSEFQVSKILDGLSERDWQFVQGMWDFINEYWPEVEAKEKRVKGVAPEKVKASPVQTKYGPLRGGYYPLMYDERQDSKSYKQTAEQFAQEMLNASRTSATTRRGHTNERVKGVQRPVRLDLGVAFEHVNQVIHDLTHHEVLYDVSRVLRHKQVSAAIIEQYGDIVYRQLQDALTDIAAGDVESGKQYEKAFNWLRSGVTIAGMGWSVSTALMQPIGYTQSIHRVGARWMMRGVSRFWGTPQKMSAATEWVYSKSDFMRERSRTLNRDINDIRNKVRGKGKLAAMIDRTVSASTLGRLDYDQVADTYFWMIAKLQQLVDVPTWIGEYEKQMSLGVDEAEAARLADQAVIDSQGGGQVKDLAAIQRGTPALRLFTVFYSYFNTLFNLTTESVKRTDFKKPGDVGAFMVDMLLLYTIPAILTTAIREAMGKGDDDEELLAVIAREHLSMIAGSMVGFREMSGVAAGFNDYSGPAGTRFFSEAARLSVQAQQGELDKAFLKALNQTAGILFHYPATQVQRTTEGFVELASGNTENPTVLLTGPRK